MKEVEMTDFKAELERRNNAIAAMCATVTRGREHLDPMQCLAGIAEHAIKLEEERDRLKACLAEQTETLRLKVEECAALIKEREMSDLDFVIDEHDILRWHEFGCRPATAPESDLWKENERLRSLAREFVERLGEDHTPDPSGCPECNLLYNAREVLGDSE
jgi:hypothetical protein